MAEETPRRPTKALLLTMPLAIAGGCVGPLGLGAVATLSDYPTMWIVAAVAMVGAAALMLLGSRLLSSSGPR